MFKKTIAMFLAAGFLLTTISSGHVMASDKSKVIDKTIFAKRFEKMDKEVGLSEFYKTANPNSKDFQKKFNKYLKKLDSYNKKYGYINDSELDKMIMENGIVPEKSKTISSIKPMGGNGNGNNNMKPSLFANGDIALITDPGVHIQGAIKHAGIIDKTRYNGKKDDKCFLSAQPDRGVLYEAQEDYQGYDECWKVGVSAVKKQARTDAIKKAQEEAAVGETYVWYCPKWTTDEWYCSKIPWRGYEYGADVNIDFDGGYWCLPIDIYNSPNVDVYEYWD